MSHSESNSLVFVSLASCLCLSTPALATELKQVTAEGFQHYVQITEARIKDELADPARFLYLDSLPEKQREALAAKLRNGHVFIEPQRTVENGKAVEVRDGLVHHWVAVGFIPGATRSQAIALAQDYERHPKVYAPDVQDARIVGRENQHFCVHFRFYRKAIVTVIYNTEFSADYFFPDEKRAYSSALATRIAEVQNPGKPNENEYPVGNDHGYMWRLNLYTRYLERDNGVYVQVEFLALSRTVPAIFAWLVNPYVRSIPREYLTNYVHATENALRKAESSEEVK